MSSTQRAGPGSVPQPARSPSARLIPSRSLPPPPSCPPSNTAPSPLPSPGPAQSLSPGRPSAHTSPQSSSGIRRKPLPPQPAETAPGRSPRAKLPTPTAPLAPNNVSASSSTVMALISPRYQQRGLPATPQSEPLPSKPQPRPLVHPGTPGGSQTASSEPARSGEPTKPSLTPEADLEATGIKESVSPSAGLMKKDLRVEVMNELIETERGYLRDLNTIITLYKNNPQFIEFGTPADSALLFSNIEVIHSVNTLLGATLEAEYKKEQMEQNVGRAFVNMAMPLRVYITYCTNHTAAIERLREMKQTIPGVPEFLERMRMHPDSNRLELMSMIIKPLQRICKYPLLLRELIKHTPETYPNYLDLKLAMEKMEELLSYLNEKKREADALARLVRIHNSMVWKDDVPPVQLVMPSRKLLLKGKFARIFRDDLVNKAVPGAVLLFNDVVLVTKRVAPRKQQCLCVIPLGRLILWTDSSNPCAFVLVHTEKHIKYTALTASEEAKESWAMTVNEAISNAIFNNNNATQRFHQ